MPISPHLTIYKPQITSVLSILHRVTGIFLFFSLLITLWYMIMHLYGYEFAKIIYNIVCIDYTFIGVTILFFFVYSLFYHSLCGIRYLMWSIPIGIDIKTVTVSGWIVVVLSTSLTLILISLLCCWKLIGLQLFCSS